MIFTKANPKKTAKTDAPRLNNEDNAGLALGLGISAKGSYEIMLGEKRLDSSVRMPVTVLFKNINTITKT
jgi:hypothetical protein